MKKQLTIGRIVCYLFCLSLICTVVIGASYARYTASVDGRATAAVAAVAMEGKSTQTIDVSGMKPGETKTVAFTVVNFTSGKTSEVAQDYTITVKTKGNLPFVLTLQPDGGADRPAGTLKETNGVWKSESAGFLPAAAETTHSYELTISWPQDAASPDYTDEIDVVTLVIDAEQALPSES